MIYDWSITSTGGMSPASRRTVAVRLVAELAYNLGGRLAVGLELRGDRSDENAHSPRTYRAVAISAGPCRGCRDRGRCRVGVVGPASAERSRSWHRKWMFHFPAELRVLGMEQQTSRNIESKIHSDWPGPILLMSKRMPPERSSSGVLRDGIWCAKDTKGGSDDAACSTVHHRCYIG